MKRDDMPNGHISLPTVIAIGAITISGFSLVSGIIGNQRTDLREAIAELKANDRNKLSIEVHEEFKRQIEKTIDRNNNAIADLLVKKDVFEAYVRDQQARDSLVRKNIDDRFGEINNRYDRQRADIRELVEIMHKRMTIPK